MRVTSQGERLCYSFKLLGTVRERERERNRDAEDGKEKSMIDTSTTCSETRSFRGRRRNIEMKEGRNSYRVKEISSDQNKIENFTETLTFLNF